MKNNQIVYSCSHCDSQYPKWQGQCSQCGKWGTIKQSAEGQGKATAVVSARSESDIERWRLGWREIENVLGGGLVPGSLLLLAGDPGIGKSTLVLQILSGFLQNNQGGVLYVCGEESPQQISSRLRRLKLTGDNLSFLPETEVKNIIATVKKNKPGLVIVDSIQTLRSEDVEGEIGNVNQIRTATGQLLQLAKQDNIAIIIIGHVTKEGIVAGPRLLEHMVDVVLYLEGDNLRQYRLLRSVKNRFGPTNQVGVFSMTDKGLEEVKNPSQIFLQQHGQPVAGTSVSVILEGSRPFLLEVQALTNKTSYGYPRRAASGFDLKRLELIIAVLGRRGGLKLDNQDVYLNIVAGLQSRDPALDLAAALAIASSLSNQPLPQKSVVLGELGLGGEVRPIAHFETRVREASRLGFDNFYVPEQEAKSIKDVKLNVVKNLGQGLNILGINITRHN